MTVTESTMSQTKTILYALGLLLDEEVYRWTEWYQGLQTVQVICSAFWRSPAVCGRARTTVHCCAQPRS
jgi:hypothetical protein